MTAGSGDERKKSARGGRKAAGGERRRGPRPATPERLEKAAYHYLERFATSAENLRRVLMRRVERSAQIHGTDRAAGAEAVDALIARFRDAGLLDDRAYAEGRVATMHRQGKSARAIRQALAVKGVDAEIVDAALAELATEAGTPETELAAAANYARRRRLGPWRAGDRAGHRERDLAALGRQGFAYDTARRVVEAEDPESLEAEIAEAE